MTQTKTRALTEGALMVAAATALSYVKLLELPQGGSVCIGMLPIFLYCARWGCKESFLASFAYGLLQLIFDGAYAWGPTSMLLDYVLAFGVLAVGDDLAQAYLNAEYIEDVARIYTLAGSVGTPVELKNL